MQKTLLIDANTLSTRLKGCGRYTLHVLKYLSEHLGEDWRIVVIVFDVPLPSEVDLLKVEWIRIPRCRESVLGLWVLPRVIRQVQPDIFLRTADMVGHRYKVPTITVCHDIDRFILEAGNPIPFSKRWIHILRNWGKRLGIRHSDRLLCVSNYICDHLPSEFGVDPYICRTNYLGLDFSQIPSPRDSIVQSVQERFGTNGFVFTIATGDPRENSMCLPSLFKAARDAGYMGCLVIGGLTEGSVFAYQLKKALEDKGLSAGHDFHCLPFFPSDRYTELLAHYAAADFYLETSLHEAFPTQVMEAMATGTCSLTSGRGGLGEVGVDHSIRFDPGDMKSAGELLAKAWLEGRHLKGVEARINFCRGFTWERCGEEVKQAILAVSENDA